MISKLAIADIRHLKRDGLDPTPEDIIRLNAMGLKLEGARNRNAANSLDYLPRVAKITPTVYFRQPTVGHEIWLEKVEQMTAPTFETSLAVKAYALSRDASALPDPSDPSAVEKAVAEYAATFAGVTRDQIYAALDYVIFGTSQLVGEVPATPKGEEDDDRTPDGTSDEDWKYCVAAGILHEAQAVLWGMTVAEMEKLTRRQLADLVHRSYIFHKIDFDGDEKQALVNYYATLDEITDRLKAAKEATASVPSSSDEATRRKPESASVEAETNGGEAEESPA